VTSTLHQPGDGTSAVSSGGGSPGVSTHERGAPRSTRMSLCAQAGVRLGRLALTPQGRVRLMLRHPYRDGPAHLVFERWRFSRAPCWSRCVGSTPAL